MAITQKSQIIDKNTIFRGCDKLEAAFNDFTQSAKYLNEAAATCSPKALSVGNSSMQPIIEDLADSFFSYEKSIQKVVEAIKRAVEKQYNREVTEYENYLAQLQAERQKAEIAAQEAAAKEAAAKDVSTKELPVKNNTAEVK